MRERVGLGQAPGEEIGDSGYLFGDAMLAHDQEWFSNGPQVEENHGRATEFLIEFHKHVVYVEEEEVSSFL